MVRPVKGSTFLTAFGGICHLKLQPFIDQYTFSIDLGQVLLHQHNQIPYFFLVP